VERLWLLGVDWTATDTECGIAVRGRHRNLAGLDGGDRAICKELGQRETTYVGLSRSPVVTPWLESLDQSSL